MDETVQDTTCFKLLDTPSLSEAMIVSTCNRLEVYSVTNSFHSGVRDVVDVLSDVSGVDKDELRGYLYVRYADAGAEHMMVVASGLDSMVVGEQQIIGQVRSSYDKASQQGTVGPRLHALAQAALHTGKRVHFETSIDEAGGSMVTFAMGKALEHMGTDNLQGKTALVLGAGAMASLAATHAGKLGVDKLIIANRTFERAQRVVEHSLEAGVPAEAVPFEDRAAKLAEVDIAISATGADNFTIAADDLPSTTAQRPLTLVDLSLPRDIDDATAEREGVHLVNIESLHKSLEDQEGSGHAEARAIVNEEVQRFASEQRVRDIVPAVSALHKRASDLVDCEIGRLQHKAPELSDAEVKEVRHALKRVVDKLLHEPTVRAKKLAADSRTVSHETALQELFGLQLEGTSVSVDVEQLPQETNMIAMSATGKDSE